MRFILLRLAAFILPFFLVACGDLPTTSPSSELIGAVPLRSDHQCMLLGDGSVYCTPLSPGWEDDGCDEYHFDCGGGDCIASSSPGTGEIDGTSAQGCPPGGGGGDGGGIGDGSGGDYGGGGDGSGTGGDDYGTGPFAEGPLAWAMCVLAVIGAGVSVDDVSDKFQGWWQTERNLRRANEVLEDLLGLKAAGYYVSESDIDMAYYRIDVATEAREDARDDVSDATGVSWLALGGAALACGASALLPTP